MTRGVNAVVEDQAQAEQNRPAHLYELHLDNGEIQRFAGNVMQDVSFQGFIWTAAAVSKSESETSMDSKIDEVTLTIQNVTREFSGYVANGGRVNGYKVRILKVFLDALDDPSNYTLEFEGEIDGATINAEAASLRIRRYQSSLNMMVPRRKYEALCPWPFKGVSCRYQGPGTACDRTVTRCVSLANEANFGGFLGVPTDGPGESV